MNNTIEIGNNTSIMDYNNTNAIAPFSLDTVNLPSSSSTTNIPSSTLEPRGVTGESIASLSIFLVPLFIVLCMVGKRQLHVDGEVETLGVNNSNDDNYNYNYNGSLSTIIYNNNMTRPPPAMIGDSGISPLSSSSTSLSLSDGNTSCLRLSLPNRIKLYNKTFDSNGNQTTLESKHFVNKIMKDDDNSKEAFGIDIKLGNDNNDDGGVGNSNNDDDYCNHDTSLDTNKEMNMITNNGTSCIICFEDYGKDDVIVWSENKACRHIYHKECMVQYLASNAHHKKSTTTLLSNNNVVTDDNDNSCPTCRRPHYCTVCIKEDDLVQILIPKSVAAITATSPSSSMNTTITTSSIAQVVFSVITTMTTSSTNNNDETIEVVAAVAAAVDN